MNTSYNGETNGLIDAKAYHENFSKDNAGTLDWSDPDLARVTRLRLISDAGFPVWDVSYCDGVTKDGRPCTVQLPFHQIPKGKGALQRFIIAHAKKDGVYAKGLGLFRGDVLSFLQ